MIRNLRIDQFVLAEEEQLLKIVEVLTLEKVSPNANIII